MSSPPEKPTLPFPGGRLRAPQPADIAAWQALGRHPEIERMYGGALKEPAAISREEAERRHRVLEAHPHAWVIEHRRRPIGEIRLDWLNQHDRRASLAIGIAEPALLGQGIGRKAIRALARHAFGRLGLHRLSLRVLAINERAIRAYEACGFVREGLEREAALIDGVWHDDVIMGLLAHELVEED